MTKICFAILAHNNRACLQDLLRNLQANEPDSRAVLFNGGHDQEFFQGLDVEVCPTSLPISWGKNQEQVAWRVMHWLHQTRADYEYLIVLDSDQLLIKPGYGRHLDEVMRSSGHMSMQFHRVERGTPWATGRRFLFKWRRVWQPLFGVPDPYGCHNPGQVFRREYAERLMRFPNLAPLDEAIHRSSVPLLEEVIYPTLAVALDCHPIKDPASTPETTPVEASQSLNDGVKAPDHRLHSPREIDAYRANPNVFLIHKVSMQVDSPDREYVRRLTAGDAPDFERLERQFHRQHPAAPPPNPLVLGAKNLVRDIQFRLRAE